MRDEMESRCTWALEVIDAAIDGDLAKDDAVRFETHLDECPACTTEMQFARRVNDALRNGASLRCPDTVIASIAGMNRVPEVATQRVLRFPAKAVWWGLAAAAILLIVAGFARVSERTVVPGSPVAQGPSADEVLRAEQELRWTFAYVGALTRRSTAGATNKIAQANPMPHLERVVDMFQN